MKKSDLFDLAIKIFGFYLLFTLITQFIAVLINYYPYMRMDMGTYGAPQFWGTIFPYFFSFGTNGILAWLFLKRSQQLVRFVFRNQPDPEVQLSFNKRTIVQISCFIIGGITLVGALADLGYQLINIYQYVSNGFEPRDGDVPMLLWKLILMIIGYAILSASGAIAERFSPASKEKRIAETDARFHFGQWKVSRVKTIRKRPLLAKAKRISNLPE